MAVGFSLEINIALVLYSVMSLNLANSNDIIPPNKHNVYAIAWAGLICMNGVLLGPWDIDKGGITLFSCPEVLLRRPIIIRTSPFAPKTIA